MPARSKSATRTRTQLREVDRYLESLPEERRLRLEAIRATFRAAASDAQETLRRGIPTFVRGDAAVSVASRSGHLAVYFDAPGLLDGVRLRHPELDCGRGCVRIRDDQHVPMYELERAFRAAMGAPAAGDAW